MENNSVLPTNQISLTPSRPYSLDFNEEKNSYNKKSSKHTQSS